MGIELRFMENQGIGLEYCANKNGRADVKIVDLALREIVSKDGEVEKVKLEFVSDCDKVKFYLHRGEMTKIFDDLFEIIFPYERHHDSVSVVLRLQGDNGKVRIGKRKFYEPKSYKSH